MMPGPRCWRICWDGWPVLSPATRHGVSPAMAADAETSEGDLGFLAGRGVEIVLLADPGCKAAMRESRQRYPQVWSEDIGGR